MNKIDVIRIKIEKLKDEKENFKFGISSLFFTWLTLLIFFATVTITTISGLSGGIYKFVWLVIFLLSIIVFYKVFNSRIKYRNQKIEEKIKEIRALYDELLKK